MLRSHCLRVGWRISSSSSSACALSTLAKPGGGIQDLCNAGSASALSREAYATTCRGLWQNSRDTVGERASIEADIFCPWEERLPGGIHSQPAVTAMVACA